ncbi:peroxisomal protein 2 [Trichomonascus vanleenenianus]|uniref:Pxp2p n=1 Tax=Trichomonascus vanleenenianus TaxID=2268995 RepID=UPI003ECB3B0A
MLGSKITTASKIMAARTVLTPERLKQLASYPLLSSSWYFVAAATLNVCNQPDDIPLIFQYMMSQPQVKGNREAEKEVIQKIREALLKCAALSGLPKTINSLTQLKNITPEYLKETEVHREQTAPADPSTGATFFDAVYGKVSKRIRNQMASAYPDLDQYTIHHVYAPLLSYTKILSPKETSLVVCACLIPQDVNPQLKGHLKGALNNGATVEEMRSLREMSITISNWCGITWKSEVAKL